MRQITRLDDNEKLQGTDPDAIRAREHYHTNIEQYRAMVIQALESLKTQ